MVNNLHLLSFLFLDPNLGVESDVYNLQALFRACTTLIKEAPGLSRQKGLCGMLQMWMRVIWISEPS